MVKPSFALAPPFIAAIHRISHTAFISAYCQSIFDFAYSSRRFLGGSSSSAATTRAKSPASSRAVAFSRSRPSSPSEERRSPKLYSRNSRRRIDDEFRADRVLSNRSGRPRSECFDLLQQRRVFYREEADGALNQTGARISPWKAVPGPKHKLAMSAPLRVDSAEVPLPPPLLLAYHKPKWVLSVRSDPRRNRPCLDAETLVRSGVPLSSVSGSSSSSTTLHPVGRLDYDSSGLLLLCSDGALTQRLLHPKHGISKEYTAVVTGRVNEPELSLKLSGGVATAEGVHTARLLGCRVWDDESVRPYLQSVRDGLPSHYNQTDLSSRGYFDVLGTTALSTVTLTVSEGKHRMVRRMLANCGHPVVDLKRDRMGMIELGSLAAGSVRDLTKEELAWARALLKER